MVEMSDPKTLCFEDAFQSLQGVVERLEKGNLPLDECVGLFEAGTALVSRCNSLLDEADFKIQSLSKGVSDRLSAAPRAGENGDEDSFA